MLLFRTYPCLLILQFSHRNTLYKPAVPSLNIRVFCTTLVLTEEAGTELASSSSKETSLRLMPKIFGYGSRQQDLEILVGARIVAARDFSTNDKDKVYFTAEIGIHKTTMTNFGLQEMARKISLLTSHLHLTPSS
ncbi:hypothetical protein J6590_000708 [Homalodisca vitripennis]|nr:hypothetical protein J6590_000708 [Homalodisca vitripennis]